MDLHCVKPNGLGRGCRATCHMGVITEDPKTWECHEYNFSFTHREEFYVLSGHDYSVDYFHQGMRFPQTVLRDANTYIPRIGYTGGDIVSLPYFIPISTGDDMHERAWDLFHRLRNLIIFS